MYRDSSEFSIVKTVCFCSCAALPRCSQLPVVTLSHKSSQLSWGSILQTVTSDGTWILSKAPSEIFFNTRSFSACTNCCSEAFVKYKTNVKHARSYYYVSTILLTIWASSTSWFTHDTRLRDHRSLPFDIDKWKRWLASDGNSDGLYGNSRQSQMVMPYQRQRHSSHSWIMMRSVLSMSTKSTHTIRSMTMRSALRSHTFASELSSLLQQPHLPCQRAGPCAGLLSSETCPMMHVSRLLPTSSSSF